MAADTRFDPVTLVKKFRAAANKIRYFERNGNGSMVTLNAIKRHQEAQGLAVFALTNEARDSLVTLLEAEALLIEQVGATDVNAFERPELSRRLRVIRAAIKVELDPDVVSPGQAKDTLKAIKAQFQGFIDVDGESHGPYLRENDHECLPVGHWSIDWDGGPETWTLNAGQGDVDSDVLVLALEHGMNHHRATRAAQPHWMRVPQGVGLSPANGVILHLYPEV